MAHGLTGNLAVWHLRMVPILREYFRVMTYDLRGHGYSDMPPSGYSTGDMATDLTDLLDALDIEQPFIVGHSFGADAALNHALRHPDRVDKVVAIEAGLAALIDRRKRDDWEGWLYWSRALEQFGKYVPSDKRTDIDYLIRESLSIPKVYGPATGRPRKPEPILKLLETTSMVTDYEIVDDLTVDNLQHITTPITLIYGHGSAFLSTYRLLRDTLPNVTTMMLPDSAWGHFGPLEHPEILVGQILEALIPEKAADYLAELEPAP
jgi:pimeloyl-ACP methyl ester carboxylesterase